MSVEYWATFSIFDHRGALYRNALALFDKVVIPVPTAPIGDLNKGEIKALSADADYLVTQKAAVRYDWDLNEFYAWRENTAGQDAVHSEALARVLVNDPPYATRLQLSEKYNGQTQALPGAAGVSVTAVPVYGSAKRYQEVTENLLTAERSTLEIILKQFPVPHRDTPLQNIVEMRADAAFQDSLKKLRKWQSDVVTKIAVHGSAKVIPAAEAELKEWLAQYEKAMKAAKIKRFGTTMVSLMAFGAAAVTPAGMLTTIAKIASPIWGLREVVKPCWTDIADKPFAPAGVIYTASQTK